MKSCGLGVGLGVVGLSVGLVVVVGLPEGPEEAEERLVVGLGVGLGVCSSAIARARIPAIRSCCAKYAIRRSIACTSSSFSSADNPVEFKNFSLLMVLSLFASIADCNALNLKRWGINMKLICLGGNET